MIKNTALSVKWGNKMKFSTEKYRGVFVALNALYDENDNINTAAVKEIGRAHV